MLKGFISTLSDAMQASDDSVAARRPSSRTSRSSARSSRDVSPVPGMMDLSGLSQAEKDLILSVNARADADSRQSSRRTSSSAMSEASGIDDAELSGLTDEERMQIHNVMMRAAELEQAAQTEPAIKTEGSLKASPRHDRHSPAPSTGSQFDDDPVLVQMDSLPETVEVTTAPKRSITDDREAVQAKRPSYESSQSGISNEEWQKIQEVLTRAEAEGIPSSPTPGSALSSKHQSRTGSFSKPSFPPPAQTEPSREEIHKAKIELTTAIQQLVSDAQNEGEEISDATLIRGEIESKETREQKVADEQADAKKLDRSNTDLNAPSQEERGKIESVMNPAEPTGTEPDATFPADLSGAFIQQYEIEETTEDYRLPRESITQNISEPPIGSTESGPIREHNIASELEEAERSSEATGGPESERSSPDTEGPDEELPASGSVEIDPGRFQHYEFVPPDQLNLSQLTKEERAHIEAVMQRAETQKLSLDRDDYQIETVAEVHQVPEHIQSEPIIDASLNNAYHSDQNVAVSKETAAEEVMGHPFGSEVTPSAEESGQTCETYTTDFPRAPQQYDIDAQDDRCTREIESVEKGERAEHLPSEPSQESEATEGADDERSEDNFSEPEQTSYSEPLEASAVFPEQGVLADKDSFSPHGATETPQLIQQSMMIREDAQKKQLSQESEATGSADEVRTDEDFSEPELLAYDHSEESRVQEIAIQPDSDLSGLTEEERKKIQDVLKKAELEETTTKHDLPEPIPQPPLSEMHVDLPDLTGFSPEERAQIEAVMRKAESEGIPSVPPSMTSSRRESIGAAEQEPAAIQDSVDFSNKVSAMSEQYSHIVEQAHSNEQGIPTKEEEVRTEIDDDQQKSVPRDQSQESGVTESADEAGADEELSESEQLQRDTPKLIKDSDSMNKELPGSEVPSIEHPDLSGFTAEERAQIEAVMAKAASESVVQSVSHQRTSEGPETNFPAREDVRENIPAEVSMEIDSQISATVGQERFSTDRMASAQKVETPFTVPAKIPSQESEITESPDEERTTSDLEYSADNETDQRVSVESGERNFVPAESPYVSVQEKEFMPLLTSESVADDYPDYGGLDASVSEKSVAYRADFDHFPDSTERVKPDEMRAESSESMESSVGDNMAFIQDINEEFSERYQFDESLSQVRDSVKYSEDQSEGHKFPEPVEYFMQTEHWRSDYSEPPPDFSMPIPEESEPEEPDVTSVHEEYGIKSEELYRDDYEQSLAEDFISHRQPEPEFDKRHEAERSIGLEHTEEQYEQDYSFTAFSDPLAAPDLSEFTETERAEIEAVMKRAALEEGIPAVAPSLDPVVDFPITEESDSNLAEITEQYGYSLSDPSFTAAEPRESKSLDLSIPTETQAFGDETKSRESVSLLDRFDPGPIFPDDSELFPSEPDGFKNFEQTDYYESTSDPHLQEKKKPPELFVDTTQNEYDQKDATESEPYAAESRTGLTDADYKETPSISPRSPRLNPFSGLSMSFEEDFPDLSGFSVGERAEIEAVMKRAKSEGIPSLSLESTRPGQLAKDDASAAESSNPIPLLYESEPPERTGSFSESVTEPEQQTESREQTDFHDGYAANEGFQTDELEEPVDTFKESSAYFEESSEQLLPEQTVPDADSSQEGLHETELQTSQFEFDNRVQPGAVVGSETEFPTNLEMDLSGLSEEEKAQIEAVMNRAESEGITLSSPRRSSQADVEPSGIFLEQTQLANQLSQTTEPCTFQVEHDETKRVTTTSVPDSCELDLSRLTDEERAQIEAVMRKAESEGIPSVPHSLTSSRRESFGETATTPVIIHENEDFGKKISAMTEKFEFASDKETHTGDSTERDKTELEDHYDSKKELAAAESQESDITEGADEARTDDEFSEPEPISDRYPEDQPPSIAEQPVLHPPPSDQPDLSGFSEEERAVIEAVMKKAESEGIPSIPHSLTSSRRESFGESATIPVPIQETEEFGKKICAVTEQFVFTSDKEMLIAKDSTQRDDKSKKELPTAESPEPKTVKDANEEPTDDEFMVPESISEPYSKDQPSIVPEQLMLHPPPIDQPDLSGLSPEERAVIEAVMRKAESEGIPSVPQSLTSSRRESFGDSATKPVPIQQTEEFGKKISAMTEQFGFTTDQETIITVDGTQRGITETAETDDYKNELAAVERQESEMTEGADEEHTEDEFSEPESTSDRYPKDEPRIIPEQPASHPPPSDQPDLSGLSEQERAVIEAVIKKAESEGIPSVPQSLTSSRRESFGESATIPVPIQETEEFGMKISAMTEQFALTSDQETIITEDSTQRDTTEFAEQDDSKKELTAAESQESDITEGADEERTDDDLSEPEPINDRYPMDQPQSILEEPVLHPPPSDQPDLSGLSEEERSVIEAVMKKAESEGIPSLPQSMTSSRRESSDELYNQPDAIQESKDFRDKVTAISELYHFPVTDHPQKDLSEFPIEEPSAGTSQTSRKEEFAGGLSQESEQTEGADEMSDEEDLREAAEFLDDNLSLQYTTAEVDRDEKETEETMPPLDSSVPDGSRGSADATIEFPDISGLSAEEQAQIETVMRRAESEGIPSTVSSRRSSGLIQEQQDTTFQEDSALTKQITEISDQMAFMTDAATDNSMVTEAGFVAEIDLSSFSSEERAQMEAVMRKAKSEVVPSENVPDLRELHANDNPPVITSRISVSENLEKDAKDALELDAKAAQEPLEDSQSYGLGIGELTPEEREQIAAVMKKAESEGIPSIPSSMETSKHDGSVSERVDNEKYSEFSQGIPEITQDYSFQTDEERRVSELRPEPEIQVLSVERGFATGQTHPMESVFQNLPRKERNLDLLEFSDSSPLIDDYSPRPDYVPAEIDFRALTDEERKQIEVVMSRAKDSSSDDFSSSQTSCTTDQEISDPFGYQPFSSEFGTEVAALSSQFQFTDNLSESDYAPEAEEESIQGHDAEFKLEPTGDIETVPASSRDEDSRASELVGMFSSDYRPRIASFSSDGLPAIEEPFDEEEDDETEGKDRDRLQTPDSDIPITIHPASPVPSNHENMEYWEHANYPQNNREIIQDMESDLQVQEDKSVAESDQYTTGSPEEDIDEHFSAVTFFPSQTESEIITPETPPDSAQSDTVAESDAVVREDSSPQPGEADVSADILHDVDSATHEKTPAGQIEEQADSLGNYPSGESQQMSKAAGTGYYSYGRTFSQQIDLEDESPTALPGEYESVISGPVPADKVAIDADEVEPNNILIQQRPESIQLSSSDEEIQPEFAAESFSAPLLRQSIDLPCSPPASPLQEDLSVQEGIIHSSGFLEDEEQDRIPEKTKYPEDYQSSDRPGEYTDLSHASARLMEDSGPRESHEWENDANVYQQEFQSQSPTYEPSESSTTWPYSLPEAYESQLESGKTDRDFKSALSAEGQSTVAPEDLHTHAESLSTEEEGSASEETSGPDENETEPESPPQYSDGEKLRRGSSSEDTEGPDINSPDNAHPGSSFDEPADHEDFSPQTEDREISEREEREKVVSAGSEKVVLGTQIRENRKSKDSEEISLHAEKEGTRQPHIDPNERSQEPRELLHTAGQKAGSLLHGLGSPTVGGFQEKIGGLFQQNPTAQTKQQTKDNPSTVGMLSGKGFGFGGFGGLKSMVKSQTENIVKKAQTFTSAPTSQSSSRRSSISDQEPRSQGLSHAEPTVQSSMPADLDLSGLSEDERKQILSVMAASEEALVGPSQLPEPTQPTVSRPPTNYQNEMQQEMGSASTVQKIAAADSQKSSLVTGGSAVGIDSQPDIDLTGLTEEERQKILSVMAAADESALPGQQMVHSYGEESKSLEGQTDFYSQQHEKQDYYDYASEQSLSYRGQTWDSQPVQQGYTGSEKDRISETTYSDARYATEQEQSEQSSSSMATSEQSSRRSSDNQTPFRTQEQNAAAEFSDMDLSHLTPEERAHIEAVMSSFSTGMTGPSSELDEFSSVQASQGLEGKIEKKLDSYGSDLSYETEDTGYSSQIESRTSPYDEEGSPFSESFQPHIPETIIEEQKQESDVQRLEQINFDTSLPVRIDREMGQQQEATIMQRPSEDMYYQRSAAENGGPTDPSFWEDYQQTEDVPSESMRIGAQQTDFRQENSISKGVESSFYQESTTQRTFVQHEDSMYSSEVSGHETYQTPQNEDEPMILKVPGMPDLDLSQFNEEERAHLLAMFSKAQELEAETQYAPPPPQPQKRESDKPQVPQIVLPPIEERAIPVIKEIQPTPEEPRNVEEDFASLTRSPEETVKQEEWANEDEFRRSSVTSDFSDSQYTMESQTGSAYQSSEFLQDYTQKHKQQYDSSDISSFDFEDEEEEERRIREIEAEFALYAENVMSNRSFPEEGVCPLCQKPSIQMQSDGTALTGQTCAECGLLVCSRCGRVASTVRPEQKHWVCGMCLTRRELAILTEHRAQRKEYASSSRSTPSGLRERQFEPPSQQWRSDSELYDWPGETETKTPTADWAEWSEPTPRTGQDLARIPVSSLDKMSVSPPASSPESTSGQGRVHKAKPRDSDGDESGGEETSSSSDEDYPDEVIEVPTAPTSETEKYFEDKNREQEQAQALGDQVLAEITKTFSLGADGEFDWTNLKERTDSSAVPTQTVPSTRSFGPATSVSQVPVSKPQSYVISGYDSFDPQQELSSASPNEPLSFDFHSPESTGAPESAPSSHASRRNPFLSPEEEDLTEEDRRQYHDTAGGENEEEDEIDYTQAARYYHSQPFYTHRPGPVYTIPEDDEEEEHRPAEESKNQLKLGRLTEEERHRLLLEETATNSEEEDEIVAAVTGAEETGRTIFQVVSSKDQILAYNAGDGSELADEFVLAKTTSGVVVGSAAGVGRSAAGLGGFQLYQPVVSATSPTPTHQRQTVTSQEENLQKEMFSLQTSLRESGYQTKSPSPTDQQPTSPSRSREVTMVVSSQDYYSQKSNQQERTNQQTGKFPTTVPGLQSARQQTTQGKGPASTASKIEPIRVAPPPPPVSPHATTSSFSLTPDRRNHVYSDIQISPPETKLSRHQLYGYSAPGSEAERATTHGPVLQFKPFPGSPEDRFEETYENVPLSAPPRSQQYHPVTWYSQLPFSQQQPPQMTHPRELDLDQASSAQESEQQMGKKPKSRMYPDWSPVSDLSPIMDVSPSAELAAADAAVNVDQLSDSSSYDNLKKIDTGVQAFPSAFSKFVDEGGTQTDATRTQSQTIVSTVAPPPKPLYEIMQTTANSEVVLEDGHFVSKLKRSPAMILHGEKVGQAAPPGGDVVVVYTTDPERIQHIPASVSSAAKSISAVSNPFLDSNLTQMQILRREDEWSSEMGRRKLPSIPAHQQPLQPPLPTSQGPSLLGSYRAVSAEELYSASAPTSVADLRQRAAIQPLQQDTLPAKTEVSAGHYFVPPEYSAQKGITESETDLRGTKKGVTGSETDLRRTVLLEQDKVGRGSYITRTQEPARTQPSVSGLAGRSLFVGMKMPATLARVLLKQELKEALSKRRQAIDACEIEANQREYAVHRMLISGLLPENRKEADNIPKVVKCSLPPELVGGVKIVKHSVATQKSGKRLPSVKSSASASVQTQSSHTTTSTVSTGTATAVSTRRKQLPGEPLSYYQSGVTVGKAGIPRAEVSPTSMLYRPKPMKDAETQTQTQTSTYRAISPSRYSYVPRLTDQDHWSRVSQFETGVVYPMRKLSGSKSRTRSVGIGTGDASAPLVGSGDDYFVPKRARKGSRMGGNRKYFSDDDDPIAREARKSRLREEIARRKEKLSSLGDLTDLKHYYGSSAAGRIAASDYSSHVPHYGSLPRVDFPSAQKFPHFEAGAGFPAGGNSYLEQERFQPSRDQFDRQFLSLPRNLDQYWHFGSGGVPGSSTQRQYPAVSSYSSFPPLDQYSNTLPTRPYSKFQPMYHSAGGNLEAYSSDFFDHRTRAPMDSSAINYGDRYRHRSLPYLSDQSRSGYNYGASSYGQTFGDRYSRTGYSDPSTGWYQGVGSSSSVPYPRRPASHDGRTADGSLLSHYANYLNNEFQSRPSAINDYSYASSASPYSVHQQPYHYPRDFTSTPGNPAGLTSRELSRRSWPDERAYSGYNQPGVSRLGSAYEYPPISAGSMRTMGDPTYYSRPSTNPHSAYTTDRRYQGFTGTGSYSDYGALSSATGMTDRRRAFSGSYSDPYSSYGQYNRYGPSYASGGYPGQSRMSNSYYGTGMDYHQGYGTSGMHRLYDSGYSSAGYVSDGTGYAYGSSYGRPYSGPTDISDLYTGPMSKSKSGELNLRSRTFPFASAGQLNAGPFDSSMTTGRVQAGGDSDRRTQGDQNLGSLGRERKTKSTFSTERPPYNCPVKRILLTRDPKDRSVKGNGLGMKVVGGKVLPNSDGELGCYVGAVYKGGLVETLGEVKEGDQILEWNGIPLTGKTYEEVQRIVSQSSGEIEVVIKNDTNLNKVYEMKPSVSADKGYESAPDPLSEAVHLTNAAISQAIVHSSSGQGIHRPPHHQGYGIPPPVPAHQYLEGKASPSFSTTPHRAGSPMSGQAWNESVVNCGWLNVAVNFDVATGTLFSTVISARELRTRSGGERSGYPSPFVKIYLLPGRRVENKRRTKYIPNTCNPEWNQTVVYKELQLADLSYHVLEFTVWDYDKFQENNFLGQAVLTFGDPRVLSGQPLWYQLVCQSTDLLLPSDGQQMPNNHFVPQVKRSVSMQSKNYLDVESGSSVFSPSTSFHYLSSPQFGPGQLWYQSRKWKLSPITEAPFPELYAGDLLLMLKAVQPRMSQSVSAPQSLGHSGSISTITQRTLRTKVVCSALQTRNLRYLEEGSSKRTPAAVFVKLQLIVEGRRVAKLQTRPFRTRVLPPCNCSVSYTMEGGLEKTASVLRASVWQMTGMFKKSQLMGELFVDLRAAGLESRAVIAWYTLFKPTL